MSFERPCKIVWSRSIFSWCIMWSTTRVLSSVKLNKKFVFVFFKLFSRGSLIPTLHLKSFNTFFSGPDFGKINRSVGLTASMWHDGSSTRRDIFVKSGSEKNVFKSMNSICLAHNSKKNIHTYVFYIRLLDGKIIFKYTWRSRNARQLKTLANKFNSRMLDASVKARKPFYCSKECVTRNFPFSVYSVRLDWPIFPTLQPLFMVDTKPAPISFFLFF